MPVAVGSSSPKPVYLLVLPGSCCIAAHSEVARQFLFNPSHLSPLLGTSTAEIQDRCVFSQERNHKSKPCRYFSFPSPTESLSLLTDSKLLQLLRQWAVIGRLPSLVRSKCGVSSDTALEGSSDYSRNKYSITKADGSKVRLNMLEEMIALLLKQMRLRVWFLNRLILRK